MRSDQEILTELEKTGTPPSADVGSSKAFRGRIHGDSAEGVRADKAKELTVAAEFNQQIDSSTLDEFVVKIYGDTAVVWFTQHVVGPSRASSALTFRYTDVWVSAMAAGSAWRATATRALGRD